MKRKRILGIVALCLAFATALALAGCGGSSSASSSASSDSSSAAAESSSSSATESSAAESSATSADGVQLSVFAANSLQKALPEVQDLYTKATGVTFADTQFEASGTLVTKLQEGASADVLITASKKTMDNAVDNGTIDDATRVDMFANDLVICTQEGNDQVAVTSIEDLAANDAIKTIAIGDPNVVPAGKYALQALASAKLVTFDEAEDGTIENITWDPAIEGKMNAGADKVGTVASYVKEGQADVGFVYTSDIFRYDGIEAAYTTPADSHKPILYPGAVVKDSANAQAAADFIAFCLNDAEAQKIFSEYGFELVS